MKILILHGPNTNLLGLWSLQNKDNTTLDKVNKEIRKYVKGKNIQIKILQTHSEIKAVSFIQQNKNKIDGIIITPGPWQNSGFILKDLLELIQIPYITISYKKNEKINLLNGFENINNKNIKLAFNKALKSLEKKIDE